MNLKHEMFWNMYDYQHLLQVLKWTLNMKCFEIFLLISLDIVLFSMNLKHEMFWNVKAVQVLYDKRNNEP